MASFSQEHPIDASGVLSAAKMGNWETFESLLGSQTQLKFQDFNSPPPGRDYGVLHQIAYHRNLPALRQLVHAHPRVDMKVLTHKSNLSVEDVAVSRHAPALFLDYLRECIGRQNHQELVSLAREGWWTKFSEMLSSSGIGTETLNTVPTGRTWGVIHQVSYWGAVPILQALVAQFPELNLELETREEAAQTPLDIAAGRGHTEYRAELQAMVAAASGGSSAVTATSSSMKVPVSADGKLCNICYDDEHEKETIGVACDNDHFICADCFCSYVQSESDTDANVQNIVLNGGRIRCPQGQACSSPAFSNKLIAMVVPDELYEGYLRARDFVVGKEAVAGALAKVKEAGALGAVEQEQIRNLFRKADGSYNAYMCKECRFGPIDHGWCSSLTTHHGEHKSGGGSISNACPKCNWFASNISQWPRWDGEFHEGGGGAAFAGVAAAGPAVQ